MKSLLGKYATWIFRSVLIAGTPLCIAMAADDSPPRHYQQSCVDCHVRMTGGEGKLLYERKNRLVNDYTALVERVSYCSAGVGADWDANKIEQTVHYLNTHFYHFLPTTREIKEIDAGRPG